MRDLEKESTKIRNGNKYIVDTTEDTGVFARDVDRLFIEYTNLRKKLYNSYKHYLEDETTRRELASYIDEQFIKLVKEYEINSPVDFPGYIKEKLTTRVFRIFIKNRFKDKNREVVMASEYGVQYQSDNQQAEEYTLGDDFVYLDSLFGNNDMTPPQKTIASMWMAQVEPKSRIVSRLRETYGMSRKEAEEEVQELKDYFKFRL